MAKENSKAASLDAILAVTGGSDQGTSTHSKAPSKAASMEAINLASDPSGMVQADTPSLWDQAKELFTGSQANAALPENVQQLPELMSLTEPVTTGDTAQDLKLAASMLVTVNPEARVDILKDQLGLTDDDFTRYDDTIAVKLPNGQEAVLNKAGLSQQDLLTGVGQILSYVPAARIAGIGKTIAARMGIGGLASGATNLGLQEASKVAGSEQETDLEEAAIATAGGAASEALPVILPALKTGAKAVTEKIPDEMTAAFEKGRVMTSDIFEPRTWLGKQAQRESERSVLGVGGKRAAQQDERVQVLEDLAGSYGVRADNEFDTDIVEGATTVFKNARNRASKLRTEAVSELDKAGTVDTSATRETIESLISKERAKKLKADEGLIKSLEDTRDSLEGNFSHVSQIRTAVFNDIQDIGGTTSPIRSGGDAALEEVRSSLSNDLRKSAEAYSKSAADKAGKDAANKWKASNRIFVDGFAKARDGKLKNVLAKGEATPELVLSVIRGGKRSELNRLHGALDLEGRNLVKQQILADQFEKAGAYTAEGYINPKTFLRQLESPKVKKSIDVFFKGKDKREIEGLKQYLTLTKRAQEANVATNTGEQVTSIWQSPLNLIKAPVVSPVGHLYESATTRNLLIKLSQAKTPVEQKKYYGLLKPLISEGVRESGRQEDPYKKYRQESGGYMENK